MTKALLAALLLVSSSVFAQGEKPAAKEERPAEPPRRPLNLKLDQPVRNFVREEPVEKSADNLPSLGGSSNPALWEKARELRPDSSNNPYPKDSQRQNQ